MRFLPLLLHDTAWGFEIGFASGSVASGVAGVVANDGHNQGLTNAFGLGAAAAGAGAIATMFLVRKTASDYAKDGCVAATGAVPHPNVR